VSAPHWFFHGLLDYYKVKLQHQNPNGIEHLATFIALCAGYLGIRPYFNLWRYFFTVALLKTKGKHGRPDHHLPVGCGGVHLRNN
jgi:hypothetical protein